MTSISDGTPLTHLEAEALAKKFLKSIEPQTENFDVVKVTKVVQELIATILVPL